MSAEYTVIKTNKGGYKFYLLWLTGEPVTNLERYAKKIEESPFLRDGIGTLLIDNVLVTGDSAERFVAVKYAFGELALSTAEPVQADDYYRHLADETLEKHSDFIDQNLLKKYRKQCTNT